MPHVGLFLPSGAGMRGSCSVRTSSFAEGKAGRGSGFELEESERDHQGQP